ncbi:hypothetical protein MSG28_012933 [Choristoneura fumiferana]|uniref:Uncharacterized protein n=1 Tax=Choristoneura fumiferana TaxID=7141 RepID=A0ACC0KRD0_CHOFU|nr:hypothetical protein MSG28_012933 [Choristoneura fumiferana]
MKSIRLSSIEVTFPKHPVLRKIWRDFCPRPRSWQPKRTSNICSDHFEPSCFQAGHRRRLNDNAVPTLFACECKKNCTSTHGAPSSSIDDAESSAASPPLSEHAQSASDDSESQIPDLPVTVKIEVDEEDISEHEDDIMEKLENKKRMQEEDPIAVDAKKVRVELVPVADTELEPPQYQVIVQPQQSQGQSQSQYVGVLQPPLQQKIAPKATQPQAQQQPDASEPIVIPEFFMNVVVRNQNEILSILKRQVLLQDPDPELLTFLRFLGSKLLRLPKNKRDELQDRITEMLYKE